MKIVICPDSFKGSISAQEAAQCITFALKDRLPDAEIIQMPLADGGEGTGEVLKNIFPEEIKVKTVDPLMRPISATYLSSGILCSNRSESSTKKIFIESANAIGLPLLKSHERNPLVASSFGLGVMIKDAVKSGANDITVSLGGSATSDGGFGMLAALGWSFLDEKGSSLPPLPSNILKIHTIIPSKDFREISDIKFRVLCDVENPLFGSQGAAIVFAPQKGADACQTELLDKALRYWDSLWQQYGVTDKSGAYEAGAGAAGGLGYAFRNVLKADIYKGIEFILDALQFDRAIGGAHLIITGEGKVDRQSIMGKVICGVLNHAIKKKIPVFVIAGQAEDVEILKAKGVAEVFEISDAGLSIEKNMETTQTKENLKNSIQNMLNSNIFRQIIC